MSPSSPKKADARRDALLDALADWLLERGLGQAALKPMADAVGTSDRMLLYYWPDKDALLADVLSRIAERLTVTLRAHRSPEPLSADEFLKRFAPLLLAEATWPTLRIWIEMAGRAAWDDPTCRAAGARIARGFLQWIESQLAGDDPRCDAALVFARLEGLAVLKCFGLDEAIAAAH